MNKKSELVNILKAELTLLTQSILQQIHKDDFNDLYKATRKLYEKMAAIKQLSHQLDEDDLVALISKSIKTEEAIVEKLDTKEADLSIHETETNENIESVVEKKQAHNVYQDISKMNFVPKKKPEVVEKNDILSDSNTKKEVHNSKKMSIGLNDRIAFINNLFNKDNDAYSKHINHLNTFDTYEKALEYVSNTIKPAYNNWEGKDEYEFRLLQLLELKFA